MLQISKLRLQRPKEAQRNFLAGVCATFLDSIVLDDMRLVRAGANIILGMPESDRVKACERCTGKNRPQARYCGSCAHSLPAESAHENENKNGRDIVVEIIQHEIYKQLKDTAYALWERTIPGNRSEVFIPCKEGRDPLHVDRVALKIVRSRGPNNWNVAALGEMHINDALFIQNMRILEGPQGTDLKLIFPDRRQTSPPHPCPGQRPFRNFTGQQYCGGCGEMLLSTDPAWRSVVFPTNASVRSLLQQPVMSAFKELCESQADTIVKIEKPPTAISGS